MKKKRAGFAALLCTLLIVLDQITKALTVSVLKVHDIVVIPGVLTLTYVENRGAAFGIFQNKKIFLFDHSCDDCCICILLCTAA